MTKLQTGRTHIHRTAIVATISSQRKRLDEKQSNGNKGQEAQISIYYQLFIANT